MNTFIVFVRPREDFNQQLFGGHMKSYSNWARINPDLWMVTFTGNAAQLRDKISAAMNKTCEIMIINVTGDGWATLNLNRGLTDWMTENI